jgi:hypothetical protein
VSKSAAQIFFFHPALFKSKTVSQIHPLPYALRKQSFLLNSIFRTSWAAAAEFLWAYVGTVNWKHNFARLWRVSNISSNQKPLKVTNAIPFAVLHVSVQGPRAIFILSVPVMHVPSARLTFINLGKDWSGQEEARGSRESKNNRRISSRVILCCCLGWWWIISFIMCERCIPINSTKAI